MQNHRNISQIAVEIKKNCDVKKTIPYAEPYVDSMLFLETVEDSFYEDDARDIINRFLCNAQTWRGEKARAIKAELKAIVAS